MEIRDLRDINLYRNRTEELSSAEKFAKNMGSLFIAGRVQELYSRLKDIETSQD